MWLPSLAHLDDLGSGLYLGQFEGGLYPGGSNQLPAAHLQAGKAGGSAVMARGSSGAPDPNGAIVLLALVVRYPNLATGFFSSRVYAGYASTALNPEPCAYGSGFAVKWLVEAEIREMTDGIIDPRAGTIDLAGAHISGPTGLRPEATGRSGRRRLCQRRHPPVG